IQHYQHQKYSNKVLIGNWVEDRLQVYTFGTTVKNRCQSIDWIPPESVCTLQGLPGKLLLGHHGAPHSHYLVSVYGETYGRQTCGTLPTLQSWYPIQPEKRERPALTPPMTFRPTASWCPPWPKRRSDVPALTTYRASYPLWHPLPTPVSQPKVCRDAPVVHRPQCE
uniref:Si:ch211-226m7.4 n=1 Tax=Scleropages formosus TaxID=113540 RepID=A0A8C9R9P9_SCLFO